MDEVKVPEVEPVQRSDGGAGCLGEAGWFFSGAVLPMGSLSYYRKAGQRSVAGALLFFVLFTLLISTLVTVNFGADMFSARDDIRKAYASGEVPEITISHGVAEVSGEQPFIFLNGADANGQRMFVAADTTGQIRQIDAGRFDQGFLLKRTEFHMLTPQNGYQVMPLSEFNRAFDKDPIILNAETVSNLWSVMTVVMVVFAFLFIALWYTVVRLMIIATIALVLWGVVSLMRPNTGFGPIIITGLYAIVPAIYLSHLFSRSDIGLPGLQTLFLLGFWVVGLVANFADLKEKEGRPMRLWTALIGVPMLILFVVDIFWKLPSPGGLVALWGVTLLTGLVLVGLRLYFRFVADQRSEPPVTG